MNKIYISVRLISTGKKTRVKIQFILLLLSMLLGLNACAKITLPNLVGDNMVLQRRTKLPVWGWSFSGEKVQVIFKGHTYQSAPADKNGKWMVTLNASEAGGPYQMEIRDRTADIMIKNILVGEVWLCSGQSNMAFDFNNPKARVLYAHDIENSANDQIRQILVNRTYSSLPAADFKTSGWKSAGPKTLSSFTAAGYFFARDLYEKYHVPVGLINSSNGGTVAEAWTSEAGLKELPQFNNNIDFLHDTTAVKEKIHLAQKAMEEWDRKLSLDDTGFNANREAIWTGANFDDSHWNTMVEPAFWDRQGYPNTFGSGWFRKEIDIPQNMVGKAALLRLGQLDDADTTYVNGQVVGSSSNRDVLREYKLPASILRPGKNIITIRILNFNGTGGMFPSDTLSLKAGTSSILLNGIWKYRQGVKMNTRPGQYDAKNLPTGLYNAMIAPLIPYAIKGVIWYQGEYNTHKAYEYRKLFPALISDWRKKWRHDFPFIYQQLPNFQPVADHPVENEWAELREAQLMTLSLPHTAMAVAIDIGGADLHPVNKKDIGYRLSLAARKLAYDEKGVIASGPVYKSMKVEGNRIILNFENGGSKLASKGGELKYFAIAGKDKKFVWATAIIRDNSIEVSSPLITGPVAVRYAWAGNPEGCNLFNTAGLPASPFRTDDWPGLTIAN